MNAYTLLNSMNAIPLEYVEEAEQKILLKKLPVWKITLATAACLCMLATTWIGYRVYTAQKPTLITWDTSSTKPYIAGMLARPPLPGESWLKSHLKTEVNAREKDGKTYVYWVEIHMSDEKGTVNFDKFRTVEECRRLASLGYELYIYEKDWTGYWGEPKHYSYVCGILSKEQMNALAELSQYGCLIDFTRYDIKECVRVKP